MKVILSRLFLLLSLLFITVQVPAQMIINTVAGIHDSTGCTGNGGFAINAEGGTPSGVAVDAAGNLYFSDNLNHVVRKVTTAGVITTVAGVAGTAGFNGENILATTAFLNNPLGIAVDIDGNLYIADNGNFIVRKVDTAGIITKVAGIGGISGFGFSGDGGPATNAHLYVYDVAVDRHNNIFIADGNMAVRKVNLTTGIITTVAGGTTYGYSGNGGPATSAALANPTGVTVDLAGNIYIADNYNNVIRWVNTASPPLIFTVAGTGVGGYSGDGGNPLLAKVSYPYSVTMDDSTPQNLYISDQYNQRVRKVTLPAIPGTGIISTVAGDGIAGYAGDGGLATLARLSFPNKICIDAYGSIYIADGNNVVREVSKPTEVVVTPHPGNDICFGTPVTFTASVMNPVLGESYQWLYNGADVGTDTAVYSNSTVVSGDKVSCSVSFPSAAHIIAQADTITMTVNPLLYPSINITRDTNNICAGLPVSFAATSVNGGASPLYQWQVNGNIVHTGSNYTFAPGNNDDITCFLTSDAICATPDTVTSNELTMDINADVIMDISIIANWSDSVGVGQMATFVAEPTNEGSTPGFQWFINGVPIPGATSNVYNTSTLSQELDTVTCVLTGSLRCTLPLTDTSAPLVVTVTGLSVPQTSGITNVSLRPNPNNGSFYLRGSVDVANGDEVSIDITDMLGQVVYTDKITAQNGMINTRIATESNLPPGMYMLHSRSGSQSGVISFVIQK